MFAPSTYSGADVGPFRVIRLNADDANSNGAVSWVAAALGLIDADQSYPDRFDQKLGVAVADFQQRNGLEVTSIVDEATYRKLGYKGRVLPADAKGIDWRDPWLWGTAATATVVLSLIGYDIFKRTRG